MCFSASASFLAGGGLAAVGAKSLKKAKKKTRFLASIPLIFGIQQTIEGFQWLAEPGSMESLWLGYGFLFFAFLLWPTYVPITVYKLETNKKNKQALLFLSGTGIMMSIYLLIVLLMEPLKIERVAHSILYSIDAPYLYAGALVYVVIICASLVLSSEKIIRQLGYLVFASAVLSAILFSATWISVWCFFAAVISSIIYFYFTQSKKRS